MHFYLIDRHDFSESSEQLICVHMREILKGLYKVSLGPDEGLEFGGFVDVRELADFFDEAVKH